MIESNQDHTDQGEKQNKSKTQYFGIKADTANMKGYLNHLKQAQSRTDVQVFYNPVENDVHPKMDEVYIR